MGTVDPKGPARCRATSKTHGGQCKQPPIPGGTVCHYHGGAAPQVKLKAEQRLARLEVPAIDTMAYLMEQAHAYPSTAYQAARDVLDRVRGKAAETVRQEHSGVLVLRHEQVG